MRFYETACGDWFTVTVRGEEQTFLAVDHTHDVALRFDDAGKCIARVRLQPDTEIRFLGKYVTSAFEIAGQNRTPPRGTKGRFVPQGSPGPKGNHRRGEKK